jgi:hypothetical protein
VWVQTKKSAVGLSRSIPNLKDPKTHEASMKGRVNFTGFGATFLQRPFHLEARSF